MEVKTGMMICGIKPKYAICCIIGIIFLLPPMTPIGAIILIGTYMRGMADAKRMDREHAARTQKITHDEDGVEYEEVAVEEYPDPIVEFNSKDFLRNARKWV